MNKKELVDYIAENAGLEKKQAAAAWMLPSKALPRH
jgi:nucleoid DNA-binding protein